MPNISNDAVLEATNRTWSEWFEWLDEHGAKDMTHKEIVALLASDGAVEAGWWRQSVSVEYEKHAGLREEGSTPDGGFQVGVRKTLPLDHQQTWDLLITGPGGKLIFDAETGAPTEPGQRIMAEDGHEYELRTIKEGERMRLRRIDPETGKATIVQIYVEPGKTGTSVGFHHEGLDDGEHREEMRAHWKRIADKLLGIC